VIRHVNKKIGILKVLISTFLGIKKLNLTAKHKPINALIN
jgi:hypothetical protein